jgi:hypothetical protein
MRETGTATAAAVNQSTSVAAQSVTGADGVPLRYVGGPRALVAGPATRKQYRFSPTQPTQRVDARDAPAMLRTRLFVRTW